MTDEASAEIASAAKTLMDEHDRRVQFHSLATEFQIVNIDTAYAVQREYVRLQMQGRAAGAIGYKVGLTSKRMQQMCGIDSPIAGVVLEDRVHQSGIGVSLAGYGRLGLEFEIAVRLARDLGRGGGAVTLADVAEAIDAVCPAMEIVDDRNCDYQTLDVLSLVADNSWNAGIVLGAFQRSWPDLEAIDGIISADGQVVDRFRA
jgi:2-keto-4-pentenoate hydratase